MHRKLFGLVGIVAVPTKAGESDALAALGAARVTYDQLKTELHETLVNSRCVTFGLPDLVREWLWSLAVGF